jgi:hypothetical protein
MATWAPVGRRQGRVHVVRRASGPSVGAAIFSDMCMHDGEAGSRVCAYAIPVHRIPAIAVMARTRNTVCGSVLPG